MIHVLVVSSEKIVIMKTICSQFVHNNYCEDKFLTWFLTWPIGKGQWDCRVFASPLEHSVIALSNIEGTSHSH